MADLNLNAYQPQAAGAAMQGAQTGMDWAHQQANLDIQRQTLQMQQDSHAMMKQQYQSKLFGQMADEQDEISNMPSDDPLKKTRADQWETKYGPDGAKVLSADLAEQYKSTMFSPYYDDKRKQIKTLMSQLDPTSSGKAASELLGNFANTSSADKGMNDMIATLQKYNTEKYQAQLQAEATRNKMEATNSRQTTRISAQQMDKAIQDTNKGNANDTNILSTMQRMDNMIDGATQGHYLNTPQFWNKIQGEEQKIIRGNNTMAEGSAERARAEGVGTYVTNLLQKLKTGPQDMDLSEWENQTKKESQEMMKSYMDSIDTRHDQLRSSYQDYPQATAAIDRSFNTLRNTMDKRLPGGWQGYKKDTIGQPAGQASAQANSAPSPQAQVSQNQPAATPTPSPPPMETQNMVKAGKAMIEKLPPDQKAAAIQRLSPAAKKLLGY